MSFYKTDVPDVLAAVVQYGTEKEQLHDAGEHFKQLFGAEQMIFKFSSESSWFSGLIFDPPKDGRFWSKPDRKDRTQFPRSNVSKMTAEENSTHTELREKWRNNYPVMRPSKDEFYKSIGTCWSNVMFYGLAFFPLENFIYIEANIELGQMVTEILGSEYAAAKAAYQQGKKS